MKPSGKGKVRGVQPGSTYMGVLGLGAPRLGALDLRSLVLKGRTLRFGLEGPVRQGASGPSSGSYGLKVESGISRQEVSQPQNLSAVLQSQNHSDAHRTSTEGCCGLGQSAALFLLIPCSRAFHLPRKS